MSADCRQQAVEGVIGAHADARRQFPRVNFVTAVELETAEAVTYGFSENISVGGMLVRCECALAPATPVIVTFILGGSGRMKIESRIVHCRPGVRVGLQFVALTEEQRALLSKFAQPTISIARRSPRIPVRFFLQLSWVEKGRLIQAIAETVLISRHGCLVLTRGNVDVGSSISIQWPEIGTAAQARIVSRQDSPGDLPRVAMEFLDVEDFWGAYFPASRA